MIEQKQRLHPADPEPFSRDTETPLPTHDLVPPAPLRPLTPYESLLTWLVLALLSAPNAMLPARAAPVAEIHPTGGFAPPAARLTAREAEVLHLVTMGLTNGEIAAHLFVSRRTVDHHLTSIYNRLGVTSRAAATRFAVLHDLCSHVTRRN